MDDQTKALSQTEENEEKVVDAQETPQKEDPRDALTPDHPRFKEVYDELKELKGEKEKREILEQEIRELREKMNSQTNSNPDSEVYTEEEEKAIDRIYNALKKKNKIVTTEDLETAQRTEKRANMITQLEKEYNGANGLPKFEVNEIVEYAQRKGFGDNYLAAYRELHFNAIVKHEASRARGVDNIDMEKPSGSQDQEFLSDIEKLKTNDDRKVWEKKGHKIMADFKKSIFGK